MNKLLGNWPDNYQGDGNYLALTLATQFTVRRIAAGLPMESFYKTFTFSDKQNNITTVDEILIKRGYQKADFGENNYCLFFKIAKNNNQELDSDSSFAESWVRLTHQEHGFGLQIRGDVSEVESLKNIFLKEITNTGVIVDIATGISSRGITTKTALMVAEEKYNPQQVFYPNMKLPLMDYYKKFMQARENILILIGPPGTGKSTWLRGLITMGNHQTLLAYNKEVITSSELLDKFYTGKAEILALEDCDHFIAARETGNELMSTFLNGSEGILPRPSKKIVFSTNLASIDKIDPALLRRGRCFDIIKFDYLNIDQIRAIEKEMDLPQQNLNIKKQMDSF